MHVFISYADEDAQRIAPICQALTAWGVAFWAPPRGTMSAALNEQIQRALIQIQSDVFVRICTSAASRSYWMTFEQTALLALEAEAYRQNGRRTRKLINIILDKTYQREPFEYADPVVDATDVQASVWRDALRAVLSAPLA
jgi:hypothetical protein